MSFSSAQRKEIMEAARADNVEPASYFALFEVEAGSTVYAKVYGKDEPLIRWEGHYFYKLVPSNLLQKAIQLGLAAKSAGAVKNPASQEKRYDILAKGKKLDVTAAISSCSWGFGQVMGSHWSWLGYKTASQLEKAVRASFSGQLELVVRFIRASGIIPHLRRKDWSAVARIYNGPNYAKGGYHTKLKQAYERQAGAGSSTKPTSAHMLRSGSKGQDVRDLQMVLRSAGYEIKVDGDFGPATERAVRAFQTAHNLEADGVAGPKTMLEVANYRSIAPAEPGKSVPSKVKEVREGTTGLVAVGLFSSLQGKLTEAAQHLTGMGVDAAATLSNGLLAGASLIGVGLAAYAVIGYLNSKKTYRGIEEGA